jgi:hypothetical protein
MAERRGRRRPRVKDLARPIYLVLDKGGPGLRLTLRRGRWVVDALGPRATSVIARALECRRGTGGCSGVCPPGKTCQTVVNLEVDLFEIPEGVPRPPSGRTSFVVKRVGQLCKCLPAGG